MIDKNPIDVGKFKGNRRAKGEDFFSTPYQAIFPIISYIPDHVNVIWECTAGDGQITRTLRKSGYQVIQTDINTSRQKTGEVLELDFLLDKPNFEFDAIIFNPPFSYKTEFLQKAIEYNKFFMFICPITILETKTRSKLYNENSLSIINLSNRIGYNGSYEKKPFFHSIWTLNDGQSKIYYENLDNYCNDINQTKFSILKEENQ
jgi:hypothetical protein